MNRGNTNNKSDAKMEDRYENSTDLFRKCMHDIRNMITLDKEMLNNIRNMSNEDKMDIIIIFNDVVKQVKIYIE